MNLSDKIISEIDQMFKEVCGTPLTNNPKVEKYKEKLERKKVDVLAFFKEAYGMGLPGRHREFLEYLEKEVHHRSSTDKHNYKCNCGIEYEIISTGRTVVDAWSPWNGMQKELQISEGWHCFGCGVQIRTIGKVIRVSSLDNKYGHQVSREKEEHIRRKQRSKLEYDLYRRSYDNAFRERTKDI